MRFKQFITEAAAPPKVALTYRFGVSSSSPLAGNPLTADEQTDSIKAVAASLSTELGEPVDVKEQRGKRSSTKWVAQPSEHGGVELSSPLMPTSKVHGYASQISDWMHANDLESRDSDYLTVSTHISGMGDKLDPVKLVLFMDTAGATTAFARQTRTFTPSQLEVMMHKLKSTSRLPLGAEAFNKAALTYLGKRDDGHANFDRLADGLIELKVVGGSDYEKDTVAIAKKVAKIANAVEIASHPANQKGEYVQRLATLLNPAGEANYAPTNNDPIPEELMRLYRHEHEIARAWKNYSDAAEQGSGRDELLVLIGTMLRTAKHLNSSLDLNEERFVKKLIRTAALHGRDVDAYFGHDKAGRLKFKRDFGV